MTEKLPNLTSRRKGINYDGCIRGGGRTETLLFLPTLHPNMSEMVLLVHATLQWHNIGETQSKFLMLGDMLAVPGRATLIGQRSNRSLACASSHAARWLILARTLISRLSARQPPCAQWTRGESGWAGSSGAAMLPVEKSPALGGLMMERGGGERKGLEARRGRVGRSASALNVKISLCHALLSAERWMRGDCHSPATECPKYRGRENEREERGGASWCMVRLKRENSNTFGSQESLIGQPERKSGVFLAEPSGMTVSPL